MVVVVIATQLVILGKLHIREAVDDVALLNAGAVMVCVCIRCARLDRIHLTVAVNHCVENTVFDSRMNSGTAKTCETIVAANFRRENMRTRKQTPKR